MIKDCIVIDNNSEVTVIKDGDNLVQIPSIKRAASKVRVLIENGKYTVVADDYKMNKTIDAKPATTPTQSEDSKSVKNSKKKTTLDDVDNNTDID